MVSLESLFWAGCVRAQIDLVTLILWLCSEGLAMMSFVFCSWWFPGVFFIIIGNVGYAIKFWGQTSTLRFGQVCAGKIILVPDSCVRCPQVTVEGTDWWHWRRGIWWRGRACGRRRSSYYWVKMVTTAAVCTDHDGECVVAELLHPALHLANLLVIPYTWRSHPLVP